MKPSTVDHASNTNACTEVRYTKVSKPCAAPRRPCPGATTFASESKPMGTADAFCSVPTKLVCAQYVFGMLVIYPNASEPGFGSLGPKKPVPMALRVPFYLYC